VRDGQFPGLSIDGDSCGGLTAARVAGWVDLIKAVNALAMGAFTPATAAQCGDLVYDRNDGSGTRIQS